MIGQHLLEWTAISRQRRCALLDEAIIERLVRRRADEAGPCCQTPPEPPGGRLLGLPRPGAKERVAA
jgi:hypothetical protein